MLESSVVFSFSRSSSGSESAASFESGVSFALCVCLGFFGDSGMAVSASSLTNFLCFFVGFGALESRASDNLRFLDLVGAGEGFLSDVPNKIFVTSLPSSYQVNEYLKLATNHVLPSFDLFLRCLVGLFLDFFPP